VCGEKEGIVFLEESSIAQQDSEVKVKKEVQSQILLW
jgi:hypothetical protein